LLQNSINTFSLEGYANPQKSRFKVADAKLLMKNPLFGTLLQLKD